jgi:hypothetical protein
MKSITGGGEAGYASPLFLMALFFMSALILGASAYVFPAIALEARARGENIAMAEMDALLEEIITAIMDDPSPEANGVDDPAWEWNGRRAKGCAVSVSPISDRINPNFTRKDILEKTRLSLLFRPGKNADGLQQYREDSGLRIEQGAYADFFEEELLEKYFSPYGWANINLIDEFAARQLGTALIGDPIQGEALRGKIQILLMERRIMDRENLRAFLGASYRELYPFVNAEPLMNANFAEPLILGEILAYPAYGIPHPENARAEILRRREKESVTTEDLRTILGVAGANPIFQYLGCVTWFWEITIRTDTAAQTGEGHSLRAVLCRLPQDALSLSLAGAKPEYRIIERRFK